MVILSLIGVLFFEIGIGSDEAPASAGKRQFLMRRDTFSRSSGKGSLIGAKPLRSRISQMATFTSCSAAYSVRQWVGRNSHRHLRGSGCRSLIDVLVDRACSMRLRFGLFKRRSRVRPAPTRFIASDQLRYQQRVRDAHAEAALGYLENPLRIRSLQRICGSSRKPLSFGQPGDSQKLKRR